MASPAARERFGLLALLVAAGAVRWIAWERTAALFNDGPRFLAIARAFDAGAWPLALRDAFHPLYPLTLAATHRLWPQASGAAGWEAAGAAVSVAAGTAAVGLLYLFLRDAFGRSAAFCGALLLAVHGRAVEYASDVQSDALYLALFAAGLWLGWRALRRASPGWAAGAGIASGLAYLTRPEGLGVALVLGGIGGWRVLARHWTVRRGIAWGAALALGSALCVLPYAAALHRVTGGWELTRKKDVPVLGAPPAPASGARAPASPPWLEQLGSPVPVGVDPEWVDPAYLATDSMAVATAPTRLVRAWEAARMLSRTARSALRYGVLVLVLIGLLATRGRPTARAGLTVALLLVYGVVLYALTASAGYVSRRHALPALLPLFGYAGLGVLAIGGWGAARLGGGAREARLVVAGVLLLVAVGELADHLRPKRIEALAERRAAEWLRDHAPERAPVAAPRQRVGYYAGMPYVSTAGIAEGALDRYLFRAGARYVVLDDRDRVDALLHARGDEVRVLHHVEAGGREAWVLERGPGPSQPAPER